MHEHFMVLYDVYVVFVGLNNSTIVYAILRSRLTDTRSAENDRIGADTDPEYRIDASLFETQNNFTFKVQPPYQ